MSHTLSVQTAVHCKHRNRHGLAMPMGIQTWRAGILALLSECLRTMRSYSSLLKFFGCKPCLILVAGVGCCVACYAIEVLMRKRSTNMQRLHTAVCSKATSRGTTI